MTLKGETGEYSKELRHFHRQTDQTLFYTWWYSHYTTKEGLSLDDIQTDWLKDDHMYAVVHLAEKPYINWDRIRNGFVVPFHMGPAQDHIYIIKIENITDALFVFKDYGGKDRTKCFCVLPYCQWGQYFSNRVYETDKDGDEDEI